MKWLPFPGENVPQNTLASYDMIGSLQFGKKLLLSLHRSGCKNAPCLLPIPFYAKNPKDNTETDTDYFPYNLVENKAQIQENAK